MKFYVDDFVNRDEILTVIWQTVRGENNLRVVQVGGEPGLGKTYLLDECQSGFARERIKSARIDFSKHRLEQGYISFVLRIWQQLGMSGIEQLSQITERTLSRYAKQLANQRQPQPQPPVEPALATNGHSSISVQATIAESAGSQIAVGANIRQVQENFYFVIQRDDPWIQQQIQIEITDLLRETLIEFSSNQRVVFLFDDWESATSELKIWLQETLFSWILDHLLSAVIIVVDDGSLKLERHPLRIARFQLTELKEQDVRVYWLEKRKLPSEKLAQFAELMGTPLLMAMAASKVEKSRLLAQTASQAITTG